jgi:hypothetical protein
MKRRLIETTRQSMEELESLFESDARAAEQKLITWKKPFVNLYTDNKKPAGFAGFFFIVSRQTVLLHVDKSSAAENR